MAHLEGSSPRRPANVMSKLAPGDGAAPTRLEEDAKKDAHEFLRKRLAQPEHLDAVRNAECPCCPPWPTAAALQVEEMYQSHVRELEDVDRQLSVMLKAQVCAACRTAPALAGTHLLRLHTAAGRQGRGPGTAAERSEGACRCASKASAHHDACTATCSDHGASRSLQAVASLCASPGAPLSSRLKVRRGAPARTCSAYHCAHVQHLHVARANVDQTLQEVKYFHSVPQQVGCGAPCCWRCPCANAGTCWHRWKN